MALPTVECFRGLNLADQGQAIYEALYDLATDKTGLPDPACFEGLDLRDQLAAIYAALLAIDLIPPGTFSYFAPDGTSIYLRPDGVSTYLQP